MNNQDKQLISDSIESTIWKLRLDLHKNKEPQTKQALEDLIESYLELQSTISSEMQIDKKYEEEPIKDKRDSLFTILLNDQDLSIEIDNTYFIRYIEFNPEQEEATLVLNCDTGIQYCFDKSALKNSYLGKGNIYQVLVNNGDVSLKLFHVVSK